MKQARQGDIFFEAVRKEDVPVKGKKLDSPILAYGEVTGHTHAIKEPAFSELESCVDTNGDIYVMSPTKDIVVEHDEHGPVTLDAGDWYCISGQREYDALAVARERRVAD